MLIIRRSEFYYTASGIITLCRWSSGAQVGQLRRLYRDVRSAKHQNILKLFYTKIVIFATSLGLFVSLYCFFAVRPWHMFVTYLGVKKGDLPLNDFQFLYVFTFL